MRAPGSSASRIRARCRVWSSWQPCDRPRSRRLRAQGRDGRRQRGPLHDRRRAEVPDPDVPLHERQRRRGSRVPQGPAGRDRQPRADETWFGVWVRVQNEGDKTLPSADTWEIHDTQENVYRPIPIDTDINPFAFQKGIDVPPGDRPAAVEQRRRPGPDPGLAAAVQAQDRSLQNRPLELHFSNGSRARPASTTSTSRPPRPRRLRSPPCGRTARGGAASPPAPWAMNSTATAIRGLPGGREGGEPRVGVGRVAPAASTLLAGLRERSRCARWCAARRCRSCRRP